MIAVIQRYFLCFQEHVCLRRGQKLYIHDILQLLFRIPAPRAIHNRAQRSNDRTDKPKPELWIRVRRYPFLANPPKYLFVLIYEIFYSELFVELFLDRCQYFENFYENIIVQKRPCLLNMIRQRYLANREKRFSPNFVTFLPTKFKSYSHESLLQSFKSRKQTTAKEAAAILDLLSNFSSDESYLKTYQHDISLFQFTIGKTHVCNKIRPLA